MSRRVTRSLTVALSAACVVVPSANAHTGSSSTSPSRGAVLTTLPSAVTVTFGEQIGRVTSLKVTRAGTNYVTSFGIDPSNVARAKAKLKATGPAGTYSVSWTIKAADGHTQTGSFTFKTRRKG